MRCGKLEGTASFLGMTRAMIVATASACSQQCSSPTPSELASGKAFKTASDAARSRTPSAPTARMASSMPAMRAFCPEGDPTIAC